MSKRRTTPAGSNGGKDEPPVTKAPDDDGKKNSLSASYQDLMVRWPMTMNAAQAGILGFASNLTSQILGGTAWTGRWGGGSAQSKLKLKFERHTHYPSRFRAVHHQRLTS